MTYLSTYLAQNSALVSILLYADSAIPAMQVQQIDTSTSRIVENLPVMELPQGVRSWCRAGSSAFDDAQHHLKRFMPDQSRDNRNNELFGGPRHRVR